MFCHLVYTTAFFFGLLAFCGARNALSAPAKPNIVIIIADDLTWHDVACFGGPTDAKTPNLDQLASEGMKLKGFYSPASVCSPTRQALLTGLYPVRNGAYPNHAVVRQGTKSLAHHLKGLGYRTMCVGKTHFGPEASYPFDVMGGFAKAAKKKKAKDADENGEGGEPDYAALERFIQADAQKPFCAYVAPHEPHGPWTKGDRSAYDPAKLKIAPYLVDTPLMRQNLAAYYAEVTDLDRQVGRVMKMLRRLGKESDTLFFFFSEQGSSVPHAKWTLYGPGTRVAAIARWPGHVKPGSESSALIQYVDVLPTLMAAAGADPTRADTGCPDATGNRDYDGRGFLDVLMGVADRHRDAVFSQHTTRGIIKGSEAYASRSVFDGHWRLITNLHSDDTFSNAISNGPLLNSWREKGRTGDAFAAAQAARYTKRPAVELYDLQADPWELTDVAGRSENAATVARLRGLLEAWMKQQGDRGDATEREAKQHQAKGKEK